jgi:hypothetical protein
MFYNLWASSTVLARLWSPPYQQPVSRIIEIATIKLTHKSRKDTHREGQERPPVEVIMGYEMQRTKEFKPLFKPTATGA